jgi:hypothetical protein
MLRIDLQIGASADDSDGTGIEKLYRRAVRRGPDQLSNFLLAFKYLVGAWEKD